MSVEAESLADAQAHKRALAATFKRRGKLLTGFLSVQVVVQALSLVAGILLVRTLSRNEYAFFTIANTMQGTMSVLADSGISIGVMSIGGRVWNDRFRFGQLINTALHLRKWMMAASIAVITPILFWMLKSNGASPLYSVLIVGAVLVALSAQLTTGVLEVVPRLRSEITRLTQLDFITALTRLALVGIAYLLFINAAIAVLAASLAFLVKNLVLRQWSAEGYETDAPVSLNDRKEIVKIIAQQAPNGIFYCVQGQVTVWLISIYGNVRNIAEVGALGRLAVIFTLSGAVMANIVAPRFAKSHNRRDALHLYAQTFGLFCAFCLCLITIVKLFPDQILWILGSQYRNLRQELLLMVLSSVVNSLIAVVWALNISKAWIRGVWLSIPLTLGVQVVLLTVLNVGSTHGVILFNLLSSIPLLLLNFSMSYQGFKRFSAA